MLKRVIKRNGSVQPFLEIKLITAIEKAALESKEHINKSNIEFIIKKVKSINDEVSVEEIQDCIELNLMNLGFFKTAKNFILYRQKHADLRFIKDRVSYINKYSNSTQNAATSSDSDPNANVAIKNVANLDGEVYKPKNREIQRYMITKKLYELYPEVAKNYIEDIEHHIIYIHDEASGPTIKNYCEAVSLYPLLCEGTRGMDGLGTTVPKNLSSFCGQLVNLTFLLSSQCKGAVAFGSLFLFLEYFCVKDFGDDFIDFSGDFVNLGPKFRKLLKKSGVWLSNIDELRNHDFHDVELNNLRDDIIANSTRPATKEELESWYQDIKSGNIRSLSLGDGTRTINAQIHQAYQQIVYGWNQPAGNRLYQSPFTNISYYDSNYYNALFSDFYFPDGTKPKWERVDWLQRDFMNWFNEERTKTLLTFPVETMALLTDGDDVIDKEYKELNSEMYAKGHSFFTYLSDNPNALASCCRLRSAIQENTFSFSNGLTGIQTGSANVITLNLNRIVQDFYKEHTFKEKSIVEDKEFEEYFITILNRVYKYHKAFKKLLYENEERGLLTSSNEGYIKMSKLFSTIGINGVNESAEFCGYTCSYNEDYKNYCRFITGLISKNNKLNSEPKYQFNTELVPAESLSSKNYKWDKEDGYWVPEDRNLYNSYFYLASDPNTNVLDKFKLHGREFTELLDGGVGLHVNLQEHLTKKQYAKLLEFAIKQGTSYFTYNVPNTSCDDCGHIVKQPVTECPKCHSKHVTQWTRVIGYLRPIKLFDSERFKEAQTRVYHK